jgi:glycosyltransferase involved in cell wall biosynthesis
MTRPLRVLHVGKFYPPHPGGMETHAALLCRELTARGVEVEVVVSNHEKGTVTETVDGVRVTRIGSPVSVARASISPGMARAIRERPADVVHFHHPNPTAVLSYLASGHPGALVVTYHSDIVRQKVLRALFDPVLHRFLRRAKAIIASSPGYAESSPVLRRHAKAVRVIPFGIDAAHFGAVDADAVAAIRARHGRKIVLAAGRLVYYKGFDYLVRAMPLVRGAHLLVAGGGPLHASLSQLASAAGAAGRVTLLGSVPDLRPYYHAADVFALPAVARSEAFGLVQLEAMACGLPVVNTAIDSGVPFVSIHGVTGLTVPPADPAALAEAINRLLEDDALRRALGQAGRARATGELGLDAMVERTLALYREAAG